jgi:hypothetical protein
VANVLAEWQQCPGLREVPSPVTLTYEEIRSLLDQLESARADSKRLNWLEARIVANGSERIEYTDAWSEGDGYGGELSRGPREFWLNDDGIENGPTLRSAIDAASHSEGT